MSLSGATAHIESVSAAAPLTAPMANLIFFGHDAGEPAVRRRIAAFADAGAQVRGFTMRRAAEPAPTPWRNVDLGQTRDQDYGQRLLAMARALPRILERKQDLRAAEIFYARNLDMLALAVAAKTLSGAKARIVYECLDIHRLMTRRDGVGAAMRAAEGFLLRRTSLLVVSAPAFLRDYFERWHDGRYTAMIVENRMPAARDRPPRPQTKRPRGAVLTIGWFGNLRCKRSLALLRALAAQNPGDVRVVMRGYPAREEIPDFDAQVSGLANLEFRGRYRWPNDLAALYDEVDLVWAGDFHDPGANSRWLLPNRIYEGGYFATPAIAPENSETGRWLAARGFGFTLPEPLEQTLPDLVASISEAALARRRRALIEAPIDTFVQPADEIANLLAAARR
jgi:succinoglycan biosynthesis protein ExoL